MAVEGHLWRAMYGCGGECRAMEGHVQLWRKVCITNRNMGQFCLK